MRNRDVFNSPRLKEIKKKKRIVFGKKLITIFLLFLVLLVGIILLIRTDRMNIQKIEVNGVNSIDAQIVEDFVKIKLSEHFFYVIPKSNIFLLPKNSIRIELENNHKRFKDIDFKIINASTLVVTLSLREATYLWCGDEFSSIQIDQCYYMDNGGYIFDTAPYFSGDIYFKFFGKTISDENPTGVMFLGGQLDNIIIFKEALDEMGIKPFALYSKDDGDMEFYLSTPLGIDRQSKIIFNSNANLVELSENLQSALLVEPLKSNIKNKFNQLEYIDLRFGNKVYYKFK